MYSGVICGGLFPPWKNLPRAAPGAAWGLAGERVGGCRGQQGSQRPRVCVALLAWDRMRAEPKPADLCSCFPSARQLEKLLSCGGKGSELWRAGPRSLCSGRGLGAAKYGQGHFPCSLDRDSVPRTAFILRMPFHWNVSLPNGLNHSFSTVSHLC